MNDSLFQELIQALREKKIAHEWKWIVEYAQKKFPGDNQKQQYLIEKIVCRRLKEEPLAYIFGEWSFLNWEFSLDRGVLIPRPETEELVLLAFEEIKRSEVFTKKNQLKIFDLGAGSACIGLSLALLLEDFLKKAGRSSFSIELNLVESSPVAQKSLKRNLSKVEKQLSQTVIHNYEKSWISFDLETGDLDVLITNPPYLLPDEYEQIDRSVKDWEEQAALIDQRNCQWGPGLAAFQEIFENWVMRGNVPLWFMEASPSCIALLEAHLVSQNLSFEIKKDINQKDRFIFNKSNTLKF